MTDLFIAFSGGILGSAHCIGMCGGFAVLVGANKRPLCSAATRQVTYSLGRVFTYTFLGTVGGFAGSYLSRYDGALVTAQQVFSMAAGAIMILVGVSTLGLINFQRLLPQSVTRKAAAVYRQFLNTPGRQTVFLAGAANGFLPCGLVYAFLAMAVASGSAVQGLLIMLVFGAGTIPVMTLVGCGGAFITHRTRTQVLRVFAVLVILSGGLCIFRGWPNRSCCEADHQLVQRLDSSAITDQLVRSTARIIGRLF